jgi:uncharacterized protein YyaL (SSP411 family)
MLLSTVGAFGCLAERGPLSNRLGQSASTYLAAAARQPLAWQTWGSEAFALAARLDRPLLLYIGSEDCGWCARMDRESFNDPEIGALVDSLFVAVRVDRDERPDLARQYQAALQSLAGLHGYPVTLFLLPDGSPFFGGTYFPQDDPLTGRGLLQLLPEVARSYREQREAIQRQAALARQLTLVRGAAPHGAVHAELVNAGVGRITRAMSVVSGVRDVLSTFAHGQSLGLLLSEYERSGDTLALAIALEALTTLVDSARPGERAGPAANRALLLSNLTLAWEITGDTAWRQPARSLIDTLAGELARPDRPVFADREAWVITALLESARALRDTNAVRIARQALENLLANLYAPGGGVRHWPAGPARRLLQDQVQVAAASLAAYAASGDVQYLAVAADLIAVLERDFADPLGGYFDVAEPDPDAPGFSDRTKQVLDDLLPGANPWAARVLLRLEEITRDPVYRRRAEGTLAAFAGVIEGESVRSASYLTAAREALARRER